MFAADQGVSPSANYIEDVFSTYLYTGNGSTQTITNGVDLAGKGGLVWTKRRDNVGSHKLIDSARGWTVGSGVGQSSPVLNSDTTNAQAVSTSGTGGPYDITSVSSTGYTIGPDWNGNGNTNTATYASWTFRKQAKFFDVVTWTGDGNASRQISHNLQSTPGFIVFRTTGESDQWWSWHRSVQPVPTTNDLRLNSTNALTAHGGTFMQDVTSTYFQPSGTGLYNSTGKTYVAYLFAHDAGGFGASGADNVISCGSFTGAGSTTPVTINLGWEPQWILAKQSSGTGGSWVIVDNMRGFTATTNGNVVLYPNSTTADDPGNYIPGQPTSTGMNGLWTSGETYIYIAIRRGPMKTPTTGTSVFSPIAKTGDGSTSTVTNVGFPADLFMFKWRGNAYGWKQQDRLRGFPQALASDQLGAEYNSGTYTFGTVNNTGYTYGSDASINSGELNYSGVTSAVYAFRRAPGFFDVVCYTGTGVARTVTHNLGVAPELVIIKIRSPNAYNWYVYCGASNVGWTGGHGELNSTAAFASGGTANWTTPPTASVFSVTNNAGINESASTYVAYLFATVAGVSKVFSYTGNGSSQTINCGFTGGARFVLIKRTDNTGNWTVFDSARGIVAGNDPALYLNSTAAEVTTIDAVDTENTGFIVNQDATLNLNVNAATYIGLAIA